MTNNSNNKEVDIAHLADLAKLELTEEEIKSYQNEFGDILDYIEQINDVVDLKEGEDLLIENTDIRNVFREDDNEMESGKYTKDLLKEAPKSTKEGYVEVQKILNAGDKS